MQINGNYNIYQNDEVKNNSTSRLQDNNTMFLFETKETDEAQSADEKQKNRSSKTGWYGDVNAVYDEFDTEACGDLSEAYRHFWAAMPQAGQAHGAMLDGADMIFNVGERIYTDSTDTIASIMEEYAHAKDSANASEGYLQSVLKRCQEKIEQESEKAQVKIERLTVVAQTYMMVGVMDMRATEGGISSNDTIQNLMNAAVEIEKHDISDEELEAYKNNKETKGNSDKKASSDDDKNSDAASENANAGIDMQKQLAEIDKKIAEKQKIIDDSNKSNLLKKQAQNAINVMNEIRAMYVNLQEGNPPEVLVPPLESLA